MNPFGRPQPVMVTPPEALPGRTDYAYPLATTHAVLGTPLEGPWPDGIELISFGMGCFWGAEKKFWQVPGVYSTAAGYQGGFTPFPTYEEACTGLTGHTESVMVAYDPNEVSTFTLLKTFWENHDPTTEYRQGNDIGTQYRSAAFWTNEDQRKLIEASREAYSGALAGSGLGPITTELAPAAEHKFYYAEDYHQQYLAPTKNPNGYDCHANTGVALPSIVVE